LTDVNEPSLLVETPEVRATQVVFFPSLPGGNSSPTPKAAMMSMYLVLDRYVPLDVHLVPVANPVLVLMLPPPSAVNSWLVAVASCGIPVLLQVEFH
jgi:hypothetical protein